MRHVDPKVVPDEDSLFVAPYLTLTPPDAGSNGKEHPALLLGGSGHLHGTDEHDLRPPLA